MSTQPTPVPGLLKRGNIDLYNRPRVRNPDGSISTVYSTSIGTDEGEVLIPRVSDDGRIMSIRDATNTYKNTGAHLGIFTNTHTATAFAHQLHNDYANGYYDLAPAASRPQVNMQQQTTDPFTMMMQSLSRKQQ